MRCVVLPKTIDVLSPNRYVGGARVAWHIHSIADYHITADFRCGKYPLDRWMKVHALNNQKANLSRTRVLVEDADCRVRGFYTLSTNLLQKDHIPPEILEELKVKYAPGAILLGQLAVDRELQRQGFGTALLAHAYGIVANVAEGVGAYALVTEAIDSDACAFYQRQGFIPSPSNPHYLFIPTARIIEFQRRERIV